MIAALKATLAHCARDPEWTRVRPPLLPLTEQQQAELVSGLRKLDFQMPGLPGK